MDREGKMCNIMVSANDLSYYGQRGSRLNGVALTFC